MKKVKNIVRTARGSRKQADFAQFLGKSQGLISKYERGLVNPPADVLDKCFNILQTNKNEDIKMDDLVKRVRRELNTPDLSYARKIIVAILDSLRGNGR